MQFHNPYHFVPVKPVRTDGIQRNPQTNKFEFDSHPQVTHDRYLNDTFSGRVVCQLTAETAFVVGDQHDEHQADELPTEVHQYLIDDKPAIPATTIRGLISNIVETASNSALRVLEDEIYSYRKKAEGTDILKEIGLVYKLTDGTFSILPLCNFLKREPAWCLKIKSIFVRNSLTFSFSNKQFYYLNEFLPENNPRRIISEVDFKQLSEREAKEYERGILRILDNEERRAGFAESSRANELFIFCSSEMEDFNTKDVKVADLIPIKPEAVKRFHDLADLRTKEDATLPFHLVGTRRNNGDDGDKIRIKTGDLVYFRTIKIEAKEFASEISFSAIWRDLVGKEENHVKKPETTFDFFRKIDKELLPFNKDRDQITLAEQMFGLVENNGKLENSDGELSLAGRIYPSAAKFAGIKNSDDTIREVNDSEECFEINPTTNDGWTTLKILASPKPPSPAMYFKNGYIAKNQLNADEHQPQGRKFYLHNKSNEGRPWETKKTENPKQKMKVKPVKRGAVFNFYLDFENLSNIELGALLYALRPTDEFRHKIGLGKPIGLGKVKIEISKLLTIDREIRYSSSGLLGKRFAEKDLTFINDLKANFRAINTDICDVLETLGDPQLLSAKVHYPKVLGKTDEEENFKWFVENDRSRRRNLSPIKASQNIPLLNEY